LVELHKLSLLVIIPLAFIGLLSTTYVASVVNFSVLGVFNLSVFHTTTASALGSAPITIVPASSTAALNFPLPAFIIDVPTVIGVIELSISLVWLFWLRGHW